MARSVPAAANDLTVAQYWVIECKDINKSELCAGYFMALNQANEFATHIMKKPLWCSGGNSVFQNHAIVMKFLQQNPKLWDLKFFAVAVVALTDAYPCDK